MFQTLKNAWSMPELRKKMLYTLFIILIFRFGSCIPVPFIDTTLLSQYFAKSWFICKERWSFCNKTVIWLQNGYKSRCAD